MCDSSYQPRFKKIAPYDRANCLSKITFSYCAPTFLRGWRNKGLQMDDLYQSPANDVVEKIARQLVHNWERQVGQSSKAKPSFAWALFRTFAPCYIVPLCIYLFTECILRVAQPLFLGLVVRYFTGTSTVTYRNACIFAACLCVCLFLQVSINHPTMLHLKRLGMRIRVACCAIMYQKSLKLSSGALGQTATSQIVNIMSNDVNRFDEFSIWAPYLIIAPLHTLISIYFVYMYVGVASFAGIAFLLAFIPYQSFMGKLFSTVRFKIAGFTDTRLRYLNEIVSGIRVIKMYCWEASFAARIARARQTEVSQVQKACYLKALNSSTYFILSKTVLFVSFLVFVLLGNVLDSEAVFVCMALLNALANTMTKYFPLAIGGGAEGLITCKRIEKFLLLEEMSSNWDTNLKKTGTQSKGCTKPVNPSTAYTGKPSLHVENLTAKWNSDLAQPTLAGISADLQPGDLLAVVGPVGCGKSSFLLTLLRELPLTHGAIKLEGTLSYSSQDAWNFNDSVRANILFGLEYDAARYKSVVEVCALKRDLALMPFGDQTLVGERGISLSGGQKARINLARAVYRDADIILMDDPLSAVDASVAEHIFQQCILNYLGDKIRILVTHQIQFLQKASRILILKEGNCLAYGSFEELQERGIDFIGLLAAEKSDPETEPPASESLHGSVESVALGSEDASEDAQEDSQMVVKVKMAEELAQQGSLDGRIYWKYIRSSGAPLLWMIMLAFTVVSQTLFHGTDIFLTQWTNKNQAINGTGAVDQAEQYRDIYIYTGLIGALFLTTIIRSTSFFTICMRASVALHNQTFTRLLRAPVEFFDTNPAGRILNRFSRDLGIIDETLPLTAFDLNLIMGNAVGIIVTVAYVNWYLALPALGITLIIVYLRSIYIISARDIKRIEGLTRSPVYSHVSNTINGLASIRAYKSQNAFEGQFHAYLNDHSGIWYHYLSFSKFIGLIMDWIVVLYISLITLSVMLTPEIAGGFAGLAISSGLLLAGITQYGVRQSTEFETQFTSVERIVEYQDLASEAPTRTETKLPVHWPSEGKLEFDRMNLEYTPGKAVLKNVTLTINGGEKIGIVGRTGAGKSSIIAALFRLKEPTGWILLDGLDTSTLGLDALRKSISIIPQDPVIFSGTVRYNLDPFSEYSDTEIWSALEKVQLKPQISSYTRKLGEPLTENGANLSVGQRQLICLARAILRKNRLLVLDEATASCDVQTDGLIQATIRGEFAACTVITIAHRLNTIMDCDRVLVLDAGQVLEYDSPYCLLEKRGAFYEMCKKTGANMYAHLYSVAKETFQQ